MCLNVSPYGVSGKAEVLPPVSFLLAGNLLSCVNDKSAV